MRWLIAAFILAGAAAAFLVSAPHRRYAVGATFADGDNARGEYMFFAAGCASCHRSSTERLELGGGVELNTPFGALVAPNISPDREHGVGAWSDADFLNAVKAGVSPNGAHYYPGFPYSRYAGLTDQDVLDIKAFIRTTTPVTAPAPGHRLQFPFNIRRGLGFWKLANFRATDFTPDASRSAAWNRGRYLVEHAAHCGECHTPRTLTLGLDERRAFEGAVGFDGVAAPAIDPQRLRITGEVAFVEGVLSQGLTLDGAPLEQFKMIDVVDNTRRLSKDDRRAIYVYLTERQALR